MHAVAALQDTASRALCVPPGGMGTCWMLQAVPSHDSASAEVPARLADDPTATHWSWLVQVSAARLPFATMASGVRSMDHAVPAPAAHAGCPGSATAPASIAATAKENRRAPAEKRHIRSIPACPAGRVA